MACDQNTFRVSSISHSVTFNECIGGNIQETAEWLANRPGTRKSPCKALNSYDCKGLAEFQGLVTPASFGTLATLTFNLEKMEAGGIGGGIGSITVANMRRSSTGFDFNSQPHKQTIEFEYDAGNSEALNPISVSL